MKALRNALLTLVAATIAATSASAKSFKTVVIDAGHGGRDLGGITNKVYEKWLALDTAMRVEKGLRDKGFKTVMTRRSDTFISLGKRSQIANRYPNSVFVSIHYNFTWKKSVSGLETFYCSAQSKPLAQAVHRGMLGKVRSKAKVTDRGVKYARYSVIRRTKTPAILVEGGFVSNSAERGRTKEGWYREALAKGIVKGIVDYRKLRRSW